MTTNATTGGAAITAGRAPRIYLELIVNQIPPGCQPQDCCGDPAAHLPAPAVMSPPPSRAAEELAKHVTRAIFALKSPPPAGSEHYRSGWDDGLEAAMDAAHDAVLAVFPAQNVGGSTGAYEVMEELRRLAVEASPAGTQLGPTDEDILVAVEEALEGVLPPEPGVTAVEAARDAVLGALRPLVDQLRQTTAEAQQQADTEAPTWHRAAGFDQHDDYRDDAPAPVAQQPAAEGYADRVVAYSNPELPNVLLCCEHGEGWKGLTPLTSDDLPDGGWCTWGEPEDACGRDVLIPQQPAAGGGEETRVVPCGLAVLKRRHGVHRWEPQPGVKWVRCPGYSR